MVQQLLFKNHDEAEESLKMAMNEASSYEENVECAFAWISIFNYKKQSKKCLDKALQLQIKDKDDLLFNPEKIFQLSVHYKNLLGFEDDALKCIDLIPLKNAENIVKVYSKRIALFGGKESYEKQYNNKVETLTMGPNAPFFRDIDFCLEISKGWKDLFDNIEKAEFFLKKATSLFINRDRRVEALLFMRNPNDFLVFFDSKLDIVRTGIEIVEAWNYVFEGIPSKIVDESHDDIFDSIDEGFCEYAEIIIANKIRFNDSARAERMAKWLIDDFKERTELGLPEFFDPLEFFQLAKVYYYVFDNEEKCRQYLYEGMLILHESENPNFLNWLFCFDIWENLIQDFRVAEYCFKKAKESAIEGSVTMGYYLDVSGPFYI
jgi:hypothetical protein